MLSSDELINLLQLEPLPYEGGYFRRTYLSEDTIGQAALPVRYGRSMPCGSAIYYLLTADNFSGMHRLITDEIYHFYYGDPVEILMLKADGTGEVAVLGTDFVAGMRPQIVVPQTVWQGSIIQPAGQYGFALVGTTMAPAYDALSFELADRETLLRGYPQWQYEIEKRAR